MNLTLPVNSCFSPEVETQCGISLMQLFMAVLRPELLQNSIGFSLLGI